jgi:hypothetical protein
MNFSIPLFLCPSLARAPRLLPRYAHALARKPLELASVEKQFDKDATQAPPTLLAKRLHVWTPAAANAIVKSWKLHQRTRPFTVVEMYAGALRFFSACQDAEIELAQATAY